ncbi:hypothetical protein Tco_1171376 [Tanacetum coccineum]
MKASKKDDPSSGTNIPINPVPVAIKPPSIANYKIIKLGKKGVYQIVSENRTDKIYISFGAMLKDISRDDLTELYRIVMLRHGINRPKDENERVLWGYLKTMFDAPLKQMATGKEISNPLIADSLLKTIRFKNYLKEQTLCKLKVKMYSVKRSNKYLSMGDFGNGYLRKGQNRSQNDKTKHKNGKRVKEKSNQSQKSKSQSQLKSTLKSQVKGGADIEEMLNGPTSTHLMGQALRQQAHPQKLSQRKHTSRTFISLV